jgi:hypothetical protein
VPATATVYVLALLVFVAAVVNDLLLSEHERLVSCAAPPCCGIVCVDGFGSPSFLRGQVYLLNILICAGGLFLAVISLVGEGHIEDSCEEDPLVLGVECPKVAIATVVMCGLLLSGLGGTIAFALWMRLPWVMNAMHMVDICYCILAFALLLVAVFLSAVSGELEPLEETVANHYEVLRKQYETKFTECEQLQIGPQTYQYQDDPVLCSAQIVELLEDLLADVAVVATASAGTVAFVITFTVRAIRIQKRAERNGDIFKPQGSILDMLREQLAVDEGGGDEQAGSPSSSQRRKQEMKELHREAHEVAEMVVVDSDEDEEVQSGGETTHSSDGDEPSTADDEDDDEPTGVYKVLKKTLIRQGLEIKTDTIGE